MRRKLPPSQAMNKALQTLLNEGTDAEGLLSELVRRGTEELLQRSLEAEVSDFLGRERSARAQQEAPHRGYRNTAGGA